ncbi:mynd finger and set [Venturia nashicola]|nr:mynd finger and set [Venturia nashicola]
MPNLTPKRRVAPQVISSTIEKSYRIQAIPHKGLGLIAQRDIPVLSTILISEAPILRIPSTMDEDDDTALTIWLERFLLTIPPKIASEKRKATHSLLNSHPEKGVLAGILQTNGFQLPAEGKWPECRGLFIEISRINHSCVPNCAQRWDGKKRVMIIVPVRRIEVGEEITVTYLVNVEVMVVKERRESLMKDFGFWCECERCKAEGGDEGMLEEVDGETLGGGSKAEVVLEAEVSKDKNQAERHERIGSPVKERPAWKAKW